MIVEAKFELVAALARTSAECTFAAVEPPTAATVAATEPLPLAETSPVRAVNEPEPSETRLRPPAPSVRRTCPVAPSAAGKVQITLPATAGDFKAE